MALARRDSYVLVVSIAASGEREEAGTQLAPLPRSRASPELDSRLGRSCDDSKALARGCRCPIHLQRALRGDPKEE